MFSLPRIFARQLNPGVILTQELKMKMFNYDSLDREKAQLETDMEAMRNQLDKIEDRVAEAMAELDFQRCLDGLQMAVITDNEMMIVFKEHLSTTIDKLAATYERKIYMDMDMLKLKATIEKDIVKANEMTAEAEAASS